VAVYKIAKLFASMLSLKEIETNGIPKNAELPNIEDIIKSRKIVNIDLTGFLSGPELERVLGDAFFTVVPSEVNENNPLVIVESYANGIPIIASNIGGIPEIVIDNETGFLFEMGNEMKLRNTIELTLSLSVDDYFKICIGAYDFALNNFNGDIHYQKLISVYSTTISKY